MKDSNKLYGWQELRPIGRQQTRLIEEMLPKSSNSDKIYRLRELAERPGIYGRPQSTTQTSHFDACCCDASIYHIHTCQHGGAVTFCRLTGQDSCMYLCLTGHPANQARSCHSLRHAEHYMHPGIVSPKSLDKGNLHVDCSEPPSLSRLRKTDLGQQ